MWRLIQGDALEVLRELEAESVDAVITDPPYSSDGLTPAERRADPLTKYINDDTKRTYTTFSGDNRD
jgi:site-specific DNA-methyltransferase (adenine-specific)